MSKRLFAALFSISVIVAPVMSQTQPKDQQDTQKEKRMEWFANAKLGIFIHWGIYSVKEFLKVGLSSISICLMRST